MTGLTNDRFGPDTTAATAPPRSLWRNRDFMLLWSGQTISTLGSQISLLAFPVLFLAITRLPAQTGLLTVLLLFVPQGILAIATTLNRHIRQAQPL